MLLRRGLLEEASSLVFGLVCLGCLLRSHSCLVALAVLLGNYLLLGLALGTHSSLEAVLFSSLLLLTSLCMLHWAAGWLLAKVADVPVVPEDSWLGASGVLGGRHSCERLLRWTKTLGPVFQLVTCGRSVVVVSDPRLARTAMRELLSKGDLNGLRAALRGPNTLSLDTGDQWKQRRGRLHQLFSAGSLLDSRAERAVLGEARTLSDSLLAFADKGHTIRAEDFLGRLSLSSLCRAVFGVEVSALLGPQKTGLLYDDLKEYSNVLRCSAPCLLTDSHTAPR